MASPEAALVRDLIHRLRKQHEAEPKNATPADEGLTPLTAASPMRHLRGAVQREKDKEDLIDAVQSLKSLVLSNCSIGDAGLRILVAAFTEGSRRGSILRHLDLTDNGLTHQGFQSLTSALGGGFLSGLEHLLIAQNRIGEDGARMLAEVLSTGRHSSLLGLDLSHCRIGDDGMACLGEALQSGNFAAWGLQSLDLSSNRFGEVGTLALTGAIMMRRLPRLMFLNLSQNQLREKGTQALAKELKAGTLPLLSHLLLSHCYLSEAAMPIVQAIERGHVPMLQAMDISGNHVGQFGCAAIAKAFKSGKASRIQHLNLSQTDIGPQQLYAIAGAMEAGRVTGLQHLDISHNAIDSSSEKEALLTELRTPSSPSPTPIVHEKGSMALERLMRRGHMAQLQYLDLSHCGIADQELISLTERMAVGHLPRLRQFLFRGNDIRWKRSIKAMVRALESGRVPDLQTLELGHNTVGENVTMALASALIVSSARGALVNSLKESLSRHQQKGVAEGSVREHLARFWRSRSFRGLEAIRVNETELKPAERIFNRYLARQYSNHVTPVVTEEVVGRATTSQFVLKALLVCAWMLALLLFKSQ